MAAMAVTKMLLDGVKSAEKALRGGRTIRRVSENGVDIYALMAAKRALKKPITQAMNKTTEKSLYDRKMLDGLNYMDDYDIAEMYDSPEDFDIDDADDTESPADRDTENSEKIEAYISEKREKYLREDRNPSKLAADAAERLVRKRALYNEDVWKKLNPQERAEMLQQLYMEIAEESRIPWHIIEQTQITSEDLPMGNNGYVKCFVHPLTPGLDEFGPISYPILTFNSYVLNHPDYPFDLALKTVFKDTISVMQQQLMIEPLDALAYSEQVNIWDGNPRKLLESEAFIDYIKEITTPIDIFAQQTGQTFQLIYSAMLSDQG